MYKTLCAAVLLFPTLVLAQSSKPASPPTPFPSPLIVAKGKLVNQTAPIPMTTIFTPNQTGLYRISVYVTLTKSDPSSQSFWNYYVQWTDDAGTEDGYLFYEYGNLTGQFYNASYSSGQPLGGISLPFEAQAGQPISYFATQNGPADNSAYSLYYTLERLE